MALMTRMARLFRADLHAVLDRIEEPEVLLRQALREMEECVGADRRQLSLLASQCESLAVRSRELEQGIGEIGTQLDVCFEASNDDLARTLLRRRIESQRVLAATARRRGMLQGQRDALAQDLRDREARLRAMREKCDLLDAQQVQHVEDALSGHTEAAVSEHDVEIALLREKQARSRS